MSETIIQETGTELFPIQKEALWYGVHLGKVFPCRGKTVGTPPTQEDMEKYHREAKQPVVRWKEKATSDTQNILQMFSSPDYAIGLVLPPDVFVIDSDMKKEDLYTLGIRDFDKAALYHEQVGIRSFTEEEKAEIEEEAAKVGPFLFGGLLEKIMKEKPDVTKEEKQRLSELLERDPTLKKTILNDAPPVSREEILPLDMAKTDFLEEQTGIEDILSYPHVITPTHGRHFYFRIPEGVEPPDHGTNFYGLHIDTRIGGGSGYIIAPPSETVPSMTVLKSYTWFKDGEAMTCPPRKEDLPEATPATIEAFRKKNLPRPATTPPTVKTSSARSLTLENLNLGTGASEKDRYREAALTALHEEADKLASTPSGSRNSQLNEAALKLGHHGGNGSLTESEAWDALHNACVTNGYISDDGEGAFAASFRSGWNKGLAEPYTFKEQEAPYTIPLHTIDRPESTTTLADYTAGEDLTDFWNSRPWLAQVYRRARAAYLAPFSVLFAVLARLSTAIPPTILAEHPANPNERSHYAPLSLFVAIVGDAGGGKGSAVRLATSLMPDIRGAVTTQPASGEGLVSMYVRREPSTDEDGKTKGTHLAYSNCRALLDVPEIKHLGGVANRQGTTIVPTLTSAWSGEELGAHNKNETDRLAVRSLTYRLSLITGVQRGNAGILLGEAETGLPQRFIWADTVDVTAPEQAPQAREEDYTPMSLPATFVDTLTRDTWRAIYKDTDKLITLGSDLWRVKIVTFPEQVRQEAKDIANENVHGRTAPQHGHVFQTRCRVAAILAVFDNRLTVTLEDWKLSGVIMNYSEQVRLHTIMASRERRVSERAERLDEMQASYLKNCIGVMLRWIARNQDSTPHTGSAIMRNAGRYASKHYGGLPERAMSEAYEKGLIECVEKTEVVNEETGEVLLDVRPSLWKLTEKGKRNYEK